MTSNAASSNAIERARLAYERIQRREQIAAMKRRARERARNIALAATVGAALALFIGLTIYNGWMPTSLRSAAHDMRADTTQSEEARTGHVRSFVKGNTCRELQFNNDRGTLVGGSLVPCEVESKPTPLSPGTPEGARLNSIRDRFMGR
jgi:hypothetical protein